MNSFETRVAEAKREIRARSWDGIERRTFTGTVEARTTAEGKPQIAGYGFVYNVWSEDLGGFKERNLPGVADEVMARGPDVRGLFNHNPDLILGRTTAGTMSIALDERGGQYVIDPPDTSYAKDLLVSLSRGDVTGSSYAFRVARGGDSWDEDPETGLLLRSVTNWSALYDMCPVVYPAYPAASSGTRDDETSAQAGERSDDGPSAGERVADGNGEDEQADDAPWRLKAVQRRMALRETA